MRLNKHFRNLSIFICIAAGLNFAAVPAFAAEAPRGIMKGALQQNLSADWLHPSINYAGVAAHLPLYFFHDALVKPMPGNLYAPCLAESWTPSPDHRVYEFKLRRGVKFHNGDEMTAEDVVYTFQRYKGGSAKVFQERIEKLEAVNPYLFRVVFKKPFPDFMEYLLPGTSAIAWIVPKNYVEKVGETEYKRHPVGCGPYKFVEFLSGQKLAGEAFEGFWRKTPKVKRLEIYPIPEMSTRFAMVKTGELDWAISMVDVFYERVKNDPALKLQMAYSSTYWTIYLAAQFDPKSPWADARVRKAASLALDRKTLADVNQPGAAPLGSLALSGDPDGVRFPPDPYDPKQARKLLADAGYTNGLDGGKYYRWAGSHGQLGDQVANYWGAVGIKVETILLDTASFMAHSRSGKMKGSVFFDALQPFTIGGRLSLLFGPQYYGNYPDIEAVWKQFNQSVDPAARRELIARIQRMMHDRTMVLPLTEATAPSACGPRVKGELFKIRTPFPIWYPCPMEDLELND